MKKSYINFFASDGTLNMSDKQKDVFREWAKQELVRAYPEFKVEVLKERSTLIFDSSESDLKKRKNMLSFINNLYGRWLKNNY